MKREEFIEYVWSFYGPAGIYGSFFKTSLTKSEVAAAVALRMESPHWEADSFDREAVRDILFTARNWVPS